MRICHVIEAAGGGSGQVVVDLAAAGLAAGDDVTVIYAPQRAEARFVAALSALPRLTVFATPMQRIVCWRDFVDCWRLYLLLRRQKPFDIIHGHSSKGGALARLAGFLLPRAVKIYTPHAFITMSAAASPIYGWLEWILSWFCAAIIVVSDQEKRHAQQRLKIAPSKLHVVLNGIALDYPADRQTARQQMAFAEGAYVVGFVGRLVPQKNLPRLVEAFALIAARQPTARLAIVGAGILQAELEASLQQRNLTAYARLFVRSNARDLMPGFDCLLCSSDYESFGLIFPEALDAGVPIVTTAVGIAEQAVIAEQTGIMTPTFAAPVLAEGVLALARLDADQRTQMRLACKTRARLFDRATMTAATRALYATLRQRRRA
jgi:glycosyltransferase involved in cell wall biosynthesis